MPKASGAARKALNPNDRGQAIVRRLEELYGVEIRGFSDIDQIEGLQMALVSEGATPMPPDLRTIRVERADHPEVESPAWAHYAYGTGEIVVSYPGRYAIHPTSDHPYVWGRLISHEIGHARWQEKLGNPARPGTAGTPNFVRVQFMRDYQAWQREQRARRGVGGRILDAVTGAGGMPVQRPYRYTNGREWWAENYAFWHFAHGGRLSHGSVGRGQTKRTPLAAPPVNPWLFDLWTNDYGWKATVF